MTETVNCPACRGEVPVEIENLKGDPIDVDCKECCASLKVAYEVTEIDTDVSVEKAPPVSFECPQCGGDGEIENPDEDGSEEFACEYCPATFEVGWSHWGSVDYTEVLK